MAGFLLRVAATPRARVVAILGLLAITFANFLPLTYVRMRRPQGNDLTVYLRSAQMLAQGQDPYAIDMPQGHGPYPLTIDTLALPLTWIPMWLAQTVWFAVNAAALVWSLLILDTLWCRAELEESRTLPIPLPVRLAALTVVLFVPLQSSLTRGQVNLLVLCLACLFLRAHLAERPGIASLWLGGAIALKLTPVVFAIGLLRERRWRTLLLTAGWIGVWAVLVPTLVSDRVIGIYRDSWIRGLGQEVLPPIRFDAVSRFTLAAVLARVWPPVAAVPGLRYWAALVVLTPLFLISRPTPGASRARLLAFALALVAIPLVSPRSENHHLTMLAGALWIWSLAAGSGAALARLDVIAFLLFAGAHWLGARQQSSAWDFVALMVLYGILVVRSLSLQDSPRRHVTAAAS